MTAYTRPRSLPVQHIRRGDEVAFAPGLHCQAIVEPEIAETDWATWQTVTRIDAGSADGEQPYLLEFDDFPSLEFFRNQPLVIREAIEVAQ